MYNLEKDIVRRHEQLKLQDANEAETRKKVIDQVLENVLGWKDEDISYEERVSEDDETKYADYIIKTADISILIEAKRIGKTFDTVPDKKKSKTDTSNCKWRNWEGYNPSTGLLSKKIYSICRSDKWLSMDNISCSENRSSIICRFNSNNIRFS